MIIKLAKQLSSAALLFAGAGFAFADTVNVTGQSASAIWQTWTTAQLNNSGTPFWNNLSWDGPNKNVGFCLAGAANCGMTAAPGALPYVGQANGKAFSDFYFNSTGGTVTATMQAQIAGDAQYDGLGWYNVSNPSQYGLLFSGVTAAGATTTFTPSTEYGLFFYNKASGINDIFLSQSSSALSNDQGYQHFAVFDGGAGNFYVGAEDLPSSHTDFDYNDMLIEMQTQPASAAPEPGPMALVGAGLIGMGMIFRRKRSAKNT
ncbi:MAG: PEP-CTERM sorting domain-containing protein [Bryobacteraceae bacterium]